MTPPTVYNNDTTARQETAVWEEVIKHGIAPILAPLPAAVWQRLYADLNEFTNFITLHNEYADVFDRTAKQWQRESPLALYFSGYFSPYFRNRLGQRGKDQKQIFQFCEPYFRYLAEHHPHLLKLSPFSRLAEGSLAALYAVYSAVLPLMRALRNVAPELSAALLPPDNIPPIALRLLQYHGDAQFFTDPHVDKSAITIIVDTDDPPDDPCLVFGPLQPATSLLSQFTPLTKRPDESVLFLGAAPQQAGFAGFRPAPHAVRPAKEQRVRHSAIFFWLLPGIDLSQFSTSVPFTDDLGLSRIAERNA